MTLLGGAPCSHRSVARLPAVATILGVWAALMKPNLPSHGRPIARDKGSPLFKFRTFDQDCDPDPDCQGFAASLLRDGLIYCASCHEFDDPWEGRPAFAMPENADSESGQRLINTLATAECPPEQVAVLVRKFGLETVARQLQDMHWKDNASFGVFSAAGNPTEPLLWSHYAAGHKGFCWILNNEIAPLAGAAEVDYCENLPEIDLATWKHGVDVTKLSFLTKAAYWTHQNEYRLLVPRSSAPGAEKAFSFVPYNEKGKCGTPKGSYLRIDRRAILGVIFAARAAHPICGQIVRMADEYMPGLRYYAALLHRRKYEMNIRPLDAQEVGRLRKS
jgi:hypothetical protein